MRQPIQPSDLCVKDTGTDMGRGVFAKRSFEEGEVVEVATVLVLKTDFDALPELLQNYVFNWTALTAGASDQHALALGYGSMYNHDNPANLRYGADIGKGVMRYVAARPIQEGEELTINYNAWGGVPASDHDNWFDRRGIDLVRGARLGAEGEQTLLLNAAVEHHAAMKWACAQAQAQVQRAELMSDNAWATTYCLSGPAGAVYLKILPPSARGAVSRTVQIAKQFGGHIAQVIAATPDDGWILFADHGGHSLASVDGLTEVARNFAVIQAQACRSAAFLSCLDAVDVTAAPAALMAFLTTATMPDSATAPRVGAAYFMGEAQAGHYADLLRSRLHLLTPHLACAAALPKTLCHGDLQARNVAVKPDGQIVFFDWDDAAAGPAGLCLHGLFAGCTLPAILIGQWVASGTPGDSAPARRLQAYVKVLVDSGYASQSDLLAGLVGSMCAGQMRFIASFGNYPGEQHHADCAQKLCALLTDLLDLCDWVATTEPGAAMASAQDYEQRGEWRRAERLVQDVLSREPHHLDGLVRYSRLAYLLGDLEAADTAARAAFALEPESVGARIAAARVCLGRLDLPGCAALLTEVRKTEPENVHAQELTARSHAVGMTQEMAATPQGLPRIALSAQEQSSGLLAPDTLALMVDLFKQYGVVQVDNMFTQDRIKGLQSTFEAKYGGYFGEGGHPDVLCVGDKRHMLTMELDHVFGAEELVASRLVLPFMQQVLGEECILSAYTAVVSLPGSAPQEVHKDHVPLFDEQGWGLQLPSFAVQIVVPLLALDAVTGATRIFKGTQRLDQDSAALEPHQDPVVPLGSCLLVDYSVAHCGMGNRSDKVRPILSLVYSRPWFRDCRNYHLQPPLKFSQAYFNNASETVQKLVGWTRSH